MMKEEEEQQAVSSSLHRGAPFHQGYPAQSPRRICKNAVPMGQKHKDVSACLSLAVLQPPEPCQGWGARSSPSAPGSLPGRGLAARLPGSILP